MTNNNIVKTLMITGSNQDPHVNDDWTAAYDLDANKDYSYQELVTIASNQPHQRALWVYHGPEFEHKTSGAKYFNPWDTDNIKLIRPACILVQNDDENYMSVWRKEIANEEGMLQGINAYNDYMGY